MKKREKILETERLILREMDQDDFESMKSFLGDPKVMYAYEHGFNDEEVKAWIQKNIDRYAKDGFGLWILVEKKTGEVIGDAGITVQKIGEDDVLEIGYHLRQDKWKQGFAIEAARALKQYGFDVLRADELYSIVRETNHPSRMVAIRNGMYPCSVFNKHYYGMDMPHVVYKISREEYEENRKQNRI